MAEPRQSFTHALSLLAFPAEPGEETSSYFQLRWRFCMRLDTRPAVAGNEPAASLGHQAACQWWLLSVMANLAHFCIAMALHLHYGHKLLSSQEEVRDVHKALNGPHWHLCASQSWYVSLAYREQCCIKLGSPRTDPVLGQVQTRWNCNLWHECSMEKQSLFDFCIVPAQKPCGCYSTACVRRSLKVGGWAEGWIHTQANKGCGKVGSWKGRSKVTLRGGKLGWSPIPRRKNSPPYLQ